MAASEGLNPKQLDKKAAAKEEIVNATSGAREIVDHAAYNARAVGKILLHPLDKEVKAGAIATAREDKAASGQKMAAIRQVGAQQADELRASARAMESPGAPHSTPVHEGALPSSFPATDAHAASQTGTTPVPGDHYRV